MASSAYPAWSPPRRRQTRVVIEQASWLQHRALWYEAVEQGILQRPQEGAVKGHCWASYPLLLSSEETWSAWPLGSVGASAGGPQSKFVVGVAGGAAGGRCLSGG